MSFLFSSGRGGSDSCAGGESKCKILAARPSAPPQVHAGLHVGHRGCPVGGNVGVYGMAFGALVYPVADLLAAVNIRGLGVKLLDVAAASVARVVDRHKHLRLAQIQITVTE